MPNLLSFEEVLNFLEINNFELVDLLFEGLQPFDMLRKPIPPRGKDQKIKIVEDYKKEMSSLKKLQMQPKSKFARKRIEQHKAPDRIKFLKSEIQRLEKELSKDDPFSWKGSEKPKELKEVKSLISYLSESFFRERDVLELKHKIAVKKEPKKDLRSLIEEIIPELEILYKALIKDTLDPTAEKREEHFKKNVVEEYNKDKTRFKHVKATYLNKMKIYDLSYSNERRDFFNRFLQIIIQDNNYGRIPVKTLKKYY